MPREAGLWDEELEESFFFEDLLASFARDNCSCTLCLKPFIFTPVWTATCTPLVFSVLVQAGAAL
jgi:hypothetical protein